MAGVEILTTEQVATALNFNWFTAWLVGIIVTCALFIIFCLIAASWDELDSPEDFILNGFTSCVIGVLCFVGAGALASTPSEYATEYKVLISEEVSLTKFYERYDVVKQDGKLFTVREKDTSLSTEQ